MLQRECCCLASCNPIVERQCQVQTSFLVPLHQEGQPVKAERKMETSQAERSYDVEDFVLNVEFEGSNFRSVGTLVQPFYLQYTHQHFHILYCEHRLCICCN